MFYVYQYLREDGSPYYIGKGHGRRAFKRGKSERINCPVDKNRIQIIEENLSEQEAFELEIKLIAQYGRKDLGTGILHNMTDGGEGGVGRVNSEAHNAALAAANTGNSYCKGRKRPIEEIQRIAAANRGKKRSDETKKKLSDARIGITDSIETRLKKSKSAQKPKTREHAENIRQSKLGENNPMYGKTSPRKGKTYEELYGKEEADRRKEQLRIKRAEQTIRSRSS